MSDRSSPAVTPAVTERYVKEAPLGRGACGVVYRARDTIIGRTVALKVITFDPALTESSRHELAARSEREARAAGSLNHPNIVTIYDAGRAAHDESFFIVMEYVEGMTLRDRLGRGPVPPEEAAAIVKQVAVALEYAHRQGIVHRDVKPANILIRADGLAKLADFGIARMESSELTRSGQSMGSPAYMSPEQALGRPADARSDLFSLGVVLYEMLAGKRPFDSENVPALCLQIVNEDPRPPSRRNPALAPEWDAVVMKAIAKRPEDRYASAADLATDLESLVQGGDPAIALSSAGALPAALAERTSTRWGSSAEALPVPAPAGDAAAASASGTLALMEDEPSSQPMPPAHPVPVSRAVGHPRRRGFRRATFIAAAAVATIAVIATLGLWRRGLLPMVGPFATVRIEVAHGLKSGAVSLGVDGSIVWRQSIGGSAGGFRGFLRKVAGRPSGRASGEVHVRPGEHTFTVEAEDASGGRWVESTRRRFAAGDVQTLEIRIGTGLTKEMELEWP